jgi:hypothetical protein
VRRDEAHRDHDLLLCCGAERAAVARRVSGVSVPVTASVSNKELTLNGAGVGKEKAFVKVYVVARYLEQPTSDARTAMTSDQKKHFVLSMLRDASREQFIEALETGIVRNSRDVMPILRERLDLVQKTLPPLEKGNMLTFITCVDPAPYCQEITIPGKDFADALLSAWLGLKPVRGDLKRLLFGRMSVRI